MKNFLFALFAFAILSQASYFFLDFSYKVKIKKVFIHASDFLTFKAQKYKNLNEQLSKNLLLSKYGELKLNKINLDKRDFEKPLGYLDSIKKDIIYLAANGELLLINDKFKKKQIKNNLISYFNNDLKNDDLFLELFEPFTVNPIRDLLYHDGFLYVVFFHLEKIDNELRFTSSVLKGKFNTDYINFKYFFKPNKYMVRNLKSAFQIDSSHTGGRIVVDENENFYISVPDYNQIDKVQNKENIFGKILKIKSINDYEIISIGHRNPQGFYYDKEKNIFIESEHGPSGGDEINLIKKGKNYGWPIVSQGQGNLLPTVYHNHEKQGYQPPIYGWPTFNPGISQVIKIEESSESNFRGLYMVASLSGYSEYYGHHLYILDIDENETTLIDKIFIGDRVRDLIYDNINDRIILTLENQESIGIINLKKNEN